MCGFYVNTNAAQVDSDWVSRYLASMRGSDAVESLKFNQSLLIHSRLEITGGINGRQPCRSEDGRFALVFNGEIFNGTEVADFYGILVSHLHGSDTAILFKLLCEVGVECIARIEGQFAFCFMDIANDIYWIGRDIFGVKPLYYSARDGDFLVVSDPCLGTRRKSVDLEKMLPSILAYNFNPSNSAIFYDVVELDPGKVLRWSKKAPDPTVVLDFSINSEIWKDELASRCFLRKMTKPSIRACCRHLLMKSVSSQIPRDVEFGLMLSGGIDSTILAILCVELGFKPLCFTVEFDGPQEAGFSDDRVNAAEVARKLGLSLVKVPVTIKDLDRFISDCAFLKSEVSADPAGFLTSRICSEASKKYGLKVLLSGVGADEIFGGYRRYLLAKYIGPWKFFGGVVDRDYFRPLVDLVLGHRRSRRLVSMLKSDGGAEVFTRWLSDHQISEILNVNTSCRVARLGLTNGDSDTCEIKDYRDLMDLDILNFNMKNNLRYADYFGLKNNIEIRVPFLNKNILFFSRAISGSCVISWFRSKVLLRELIKESSCAFVLHQKKAGFGIPLNLWLGKTESLKKSDLFKSSFATNHSYSVLTLMMLRSLVKGET